MPIEIASRIHQRLRLTAAAAFAGALLLASAACGSPPAAPSQTRNTEAACSTGRDRLATLSDRPKLLPVRDATLRVLSRLPRAPRLLLTRMPDEHNVYRVTGQVVGVRRSSRGIRLTISDGTSRRLVAVVPPTRCMTRARRNDRARVERVTSHVKVCSDAAVVGVVFHSAPHSGTEGLRNGIELAPVLSFTCLAPTIPFGH